MTATPTSRTLQYYKDLGWHPWGTEQWNPWAGKKKDLFGFIDIVVISPTHLIGVQTTSGDNHAARITKILNNFYAYAWLQTGCKIVVMSWRKLANGKYDRREEEVTLDMFQST